MSQAPFTLTPAEYGAYLAEQRIAAGYELTDEQAEAAARILAASTDEAVAS